VAGEVITLGEGRLRCVEAVGEVVDAVAAVVTGCASVVAPEGQTLRCSCRSRAKAR
jgi:hypothetical protein